MSSKVYKSGSDSVIESNLLEDSQMVTLVSKSDSVVNPSFNCLAGKTIIINLPIKFDEKILKRNKVISRFPLITEFNYKLIPYPEIEFNFNEHSDQYTPRILNKYVLLDPNYKVEGSERFLLGTDLEINGELTLIGYLVLKTIKS